MNYIPFRSCRFVVSCTHTNTLTHTWDGRWTYTLIDYFRYMNAVANSRTGTEREVLSRFAIGRLLKFQIALCNGPRQATNTAADQTPRWLAQPPEPLLYISRSIMLGGLVVVIISLLLFVWKTRPCGLRLNLQRGSLTIHTRDYLCIMNCYCLYAYLSFSH